MRVTAHHLRIGGPGAEETQQSPRVRWLLLRLKVSSGLITDPWIDVGKERAGFGFAAVHQFHFCGILSVLHLPVVVVTEFKKPNPKAASNSANAVRSRGRLDLDSAFEVLGKGCI